jgi:hypothetical protein
VLTGARLNANKSQVELNECKMEIIDDYENAYSKNSSDDDRAKYDARFKGAQRIKPGFG